MEYALVYTKYFTVILYSTWLELQIGCVMETSDNYDFLRSQADYRNELEEEVFELEEVFEFELN